MSTETQMDQPVVLVVGSEQPQATRPPVAGLDPLYPKLFIVDSETGAVDKVVPYHARLLENGPAVTYVDFAVRQGDYGLTRYILVDEACRNWVEPARQDRPFVRPVEVPLNFIDRQGQEWVWSLKTDCFVEGEVNLVENARRGRIKRAPRGCTC